MITLNHGQPKPNDFFLIALPHTGEPMGDKVSIGDDPLKVATLKDPKSGEETPVEIHSMWRLDTGEDGVLIDSWAKLTYNVTGKQLVTYMARQYPTISFNQVEFLLCKKV